MFVTKGFAVESNFAAIKTLDMDPSKARIMDIFEYFYESHVLNIFENCHPRGDSNKNPKRMFSLRIALDCQ